MADSGSFRQLTRERLLHEMLRSVKKGRSNAEWKVLIMDELTVKVMSSSCKMADITEEGISLVENLHKSRQPLPALEAVYFVQPTKESIRRLITDMSGKTSLYKKAFVFFSSSVLPELIQDIKSDKTLLSRIAALQEVNLEYLPIDMQGFITDNEKALEQIYGRHDNYDRLIDTMGRRLVTVFASMKEFPFVRYRAAKCASAGGTTMPLEADLAPTKLAAVFWDYLMKYKTSLKGFPEYETCELIILDRSVDTIAPVIHEWTYGALCHDLLKLDGNKYVYEITASSGKNERKEVLLEEHDPLWIELRDLHIADVNLRLSDKMALLGSKNKAAELHIGKREGQDLSTRDIHKMVQALPQYRDQIDKLGLHIHIATVLNDEIRKHNLSIIGNLEQDLVFGDASSKELINFLSTNEGTSTEDKLRLLLTYAASHPEKLDESKRLQYMKLARLDEEDMSAIRNLECLGVSVTKKKSSGFSLKFGTRQNNRTHRKERNQEEESWQLSRFYPAIEDVIEDSVKGVLSKEDYPYIKEPTSSGSQSAAGDGSSHRLPGGPNGRPAQSMRTSKPGATWASRSRASDDGYSSESSLQSVPSDPKICGSRVFVFVIGGITHSELRAVHRLSAKLKREVIVGSTNIDNPHQFLVKLKALTPLGILNF